jgi:hypothetical protein
MKPMTFFGSGAVERNRTSTSEAHSDLNAARLPFPPRPRFFEAFCPGYGYRPRFRQESGPAALANLPWGCKEALRRLFLLAK